MSLQDRAHQREQARLERNQRLGLAAAPPRRTVTITDEQLARADWDFAERTMANLKPIYVNGSGSGDWRWVGQLTTTATAAANVSSTLNTMTTAIGNLGRAWVSYNPSMYTTTFTIDSNDVARWAGWNTAYVETEEARVELEQQRAERERQLHERMRAEQELRAERAAEYEAAQATARELLNAHLDAQQKRDMLEHGWFEVISNTGRRWRIRTTSYAGNIDLMPPEGGSVRLASYCAHSPDHYLPLADHHLIQKIVLEADEAAFLAVANLNYYDETRYDEPDLIPDRRRELRERARAERVMRQPDYRREERPVVIDDVAQNWGVA